MATVASRTLGPVATARSAAGRPHNRLTALRNPCRHGASRVNPRSSKGFHAGSQAPRKQLSVSAVAADQGVEHTFAVTERMDALKAAGKKALIPFLMAGDPNLETTAKALKILDAEGADVLELGVPYSDPLADGPTIQAAATRALLDQNTTLDKVLDMLRGVKDDITAPVVLFTYYNPIMRRGMEEFCKQAKEAGASGLLVPDIPLEQTVDIKRVAREHGIELVLLATPTTSVDRMRKIAEATSGFVYLVSVTGVTGVRTKVADRVSDLVDQLKSVTDKPIAVGFGVSKAEHAQNIVDMGGDGVICGSALVKALGESGSPEEGLEVMTELFKELRAATPK